MDFLPPSTGGPGEFYTKTIQQTHDVLNNLKTYFHDYDGQGYEIAGMVWFQGWNDMGDPSHYAEQLADFIRDIRKEFKVPKMPEFKGNVLCVSTRPYWDEEAAKDFEIWRQCKAAAGHAQQQKKNKEEVEACWDPWKKVEKRYGQIASNFPFHYCGSGRCFWGMGKAMGDGMIELLKNETK